MMSPKPSPCTHLFTTNVPTLPPSPLGDLHIARTLLSLFLRLDAMPLPLGHQIFEAMGDYVPEPLFYEWALPCMKRISEELRARHPDVPLLVFPRGATYSLAALQVWKYAASL